MSRETDVDKSMGISDGPGTPAPTAPPAPAKNACLSTSRSGTYAQGLLNMRRAWASVGPSGRYVVMPNGRADTWWHYHADLPKPPKDRRSSFKSASRARQALADAVPAGQPPPELEAAFVPIDHPPRAIKWDVYDTLSGRVFGPFGSPGSTPEDTALPDAAEPFLEQHPYTAWQRRVAQVLAGPCTPDAVGESLRLRDKFPEEGPTKVKAAPHPRPGRFLEDVFAPDPRLVEKDRTKMEYARDMEALLHAHFGDGQQASPEAMPRRLEHPAQQYTDFPWFQQLLRCRDAGAAAAEMRRLDVTARLYFELHWEDEDALLSSEEE